MKNSRAAPSKRSQVEMTLDYIVGFMLCLLLTMCTVGSVYVGLRTRNEGRRMWYLLDVDGVDEGGTTANQYNYAKSYQVGIFVGITQFILYGYLIPISLYVSLEMVKVAQSMYFINLDRRMYHGDSDTAASARTSNLNEELGQVRTIMSDKTGTLTRNTMEFFKLSVGGTKFGAGYTDIERSLAARKGVLIPKPSSLPIEKGFNFADDRIVGPAGDLAWLRLPQAEQFRRMCQARGCGWCCDQPCSWGATP